MRYNDEHYIMIHPGGRFLTFTKHLFIEIQNFGSLPQKIRHPIIEEVEYEPYEDIGEGI